MYPRVPSAGASWGGLVAIVRACVCVCVCVIHSPQTGASPALILDSIGEKRDGSMAVVRGRGNPDVVESPSQQ